MISDDMQMRAIAQYYGYEQVVLLALQAGVDVLAIANQLQYDPDMAAKTIAIVKKLLHEGNLTPARIDESDARIEESHDGGKTWQVTSDGLQVPWRRHMVERFEQVGEELFAVLSNGELLVAPLASLQWKRVLTELDDVHAVTSLKK